MPRHIPFPSLFIIKFMNVIYAVSYTFLFNPLGLAPATMAFVSGGLFGLLLLPVGAFYLILSVLEQLEGPWHDLTVYSLYGFLAWYFVMLIVDKTHCRVKDTCFRKPTDFTDDISYQFFLDLFHYFSMTCVPATPRVKELLAEDRQYILGVHPHGIHCFPLAFLASPDTPFDKEFPGLVSGSKTTAKHPLVGLCATVMFRIPVVREFFLTFGYIDASRHIANAALLDGKSLFICTGGEEESMFTTSEEDVVVLKHRKGFVRLALSHGAALVPVFGINNGLTFKTYSFLMPLRLWIQKTFKVALPIFHGRFCTPLPYKVPIKVVVGEPIQTPKPNKAGEKPDDKLVDKYHQMYIDALKEIHNNFAEPGRPLRIV